MDVGISVWLCGPGACSTKDILQRFNWLTKGSSPSPSMLSSVLNVFCVKLTFACISKVLSLSMVYECVCVCMCVCVCVHVCVCVCVWCAGMMIAR